MGNFGPFHMHNIMGNVRLPDPFENDKGNITRALLDADLLAEIDSAKKAQEQKIWDAKAPVYNAFIADIAALFRKYGLYLDLTGEDIHVLTDAMHIVAKDDEITTNLKGRSDQELSDYADGKNYASVHIPKPSAHDQLAVKALRSKLQADAKGGAA